MKDHVRLVSRVPGGATIRLPGTGSEADPAVIADGVTGAEFAASASSVTRRRRWARACWCGTPDIAIVDVEVTGAVSVAIAVE